MLVNDCGLPILEENDFASVASLRELAEAADNLFYQQEVNIDYLERPEAIITKLSANQVYSAGGSNYTTINFDTTSYISRYGAFSGSGITMSKDWRPGVYHIGGFIDGVTAGTVISLWADLRLYDERGVRLLNTYTEFVRNVEGSSLRGATALAFNQLVEIHSPNRCRIAVEANMINTGNVTVQAYSRLWAYRVRGLADV